MGSHPPWRIRSEAAAPARSIRLAFGMSPPGTTAPPPIVFGIRLPRRSVRRLLRLAGGGAAVLLVSTALLMAYRAAFGTPEWWRYIAPQATLMGERSIAVWIASLILLLAGAVFGLCYVAERRARGAAAAGWIVIAAGFAALSLDEVGSLHERLGDLHAVLPVSSAMVWLRVMAVPLGAAALLLGIFAWRRLRRHPAVVGLLLGGAALFTTIPLQEELETRQWAARAAAAEATGGTIPPRAWYMVVIEEGTELAGSLAFLTAGLIYLHRISLRPRRPRRGSIGAIDTAITGAELRTASRSVTAALAVGLASAAVLHLLAPGTSARGDPVPWFAAVGGLLAGAAAWLLPPERGWLDRRAVLSVACLFWSVDQGGVFVFTDGIWEGSPRVQVAIRLLLAVGTAAVAAYVARAPIAGGLRRRVIAWGALAAAAPLAGHPVAIASLLFAAHAVLLMSLVDHYVAAASASAATPVARAATTLSPALPSQPSGREG